MLSRVDMRAADVGAWLNEELFEWLWDRSAQPFGGSMVAARRWEYRRDWSGVSSALFIEGIFKDAGGVPIAGATMTPFRATADVNNSRTANCQEGTVVVTDTDGNFRIGVPTADAYHVRGYKAGAPNLAGTSDSTLVGA